MDLYNLIKDKKKHVFTSSEFKCTRNDIYLKIWFRVDMYIRM